MAVDLDDEEIERIAREQRVVRGYREAARRALAFARQYREEEGAPGGEREKACILQAQEWRAAIRELHAGGAPRPGLARAREKQPDSKRRAG